MDKAPKKGRNMTHLKKTEAAPCGWGRGVERWRQGPDHTSPPAATAVTFLHSPPTGEANGQ